MSLTSSQSFTVKHHDPRKHRRKVIIWVLFLLISLYGFYELGRWRAGYDMLASIEEINGLKETINNLEAEKQDLITKNADVTSASAIDKHASSDVRNKLDVVNKEMLELKEELAFYRSLLDPAQHKPGLYLHKFELKRDRYTGNFHYRVVLTQVRGNDRFVSGSIEVEVKGQHEGEEKILSLPELVDTKTKKLPFRFKYLQEIEGSLTLPEEFKPSDVLVRVKPKTSRFETIEKAYTWDTITAGG